MGWFTFGDALGVANLGLGIAGAFDGGNKKAAKQARAAQARIEGIVNDVNSEGPMFQSAYEGKRGVLDRDFARDLNALRTKNNRAIARTGGIGFINPERADEAMASALLRNQTDLRARARDEARNTLLQSAGLYGQTAGLTAQANRADQTDRNRMYGGLSAALYGLNALGNRGGYTSQPISNLWTGNNNVVTTPRYRPPSYTASGAYAGPNSW